MILKEILQKKTIFAFNCDDFVIYRGIVEAAKKVGSPIIVQLSPGEVNFWGLKRFITLVRSENSSLFINFDHSRELSLARKIIDLAPDMIHFDGSDLSWEENIRLTSQVVKLAHQKGVLVEGEPEPDQTDPQRAAEFVQKTGVDLIAVFVGNRHGFDPQKPEKLDLERLRAIKQEVGQTVLALHGGSGVAQEDLEAAIKQRLVAKININSQLRWAYRQELEQQLKNYSGVKVYQLMTPIINRITSEVFEILKIVN